MPEYRKVKKDRAYTHEEISRLLEISDERMRAIVLLLASAGMRIGAVPFIRLRNVENMENIAKITVYEGTKEEYFTFITPECRKAIDNYMDMRLRYGEILNDNSYLIREQFDLKDPTSKPKQTRSNTMSVRLISMSERIGIRNQGIPAAHGFRKFFTTQLVNSRVNPEIREMLLGHDIGLAGAYYKPTVEEMYAEYEKALDNLTIDPANRLQSKIETLTIEKSRLDRIEEKMLKMEQMYQK
jgi:integrase